MKTVTFNLPNGYFSKLRVRHHLFNKAEAIGKRLRLSFTFKQKPDTIEIVFKDLTHFDLFIMAWEKQYYFEEFEIGSC